MLSERITRILQEYFGSLPQETLARLALVVERDALADGGLPHAMLLGLLRPQLRLNRMPRLSGPLRAFCVPFEDLLNDAPRKEKQQGCIARRSILPVWDWLARDLIPDAVRDFIGDYKSFLLAGEVDNAEQCARGFRRQAGEAMLDAFALDAATARAALGDAMLVRDAEEMALLASGEALMDELKMLLPKPVATLSETHLNGFRALYERALGEMPDIVPYLPVAAMRRLEKQWQALRLAMMVSRRRSETMIAATDVGLVGDILFSRLEDAKADIQTARKPDFDVEELLDRLTDFTLLSNGITGEVELLRSGRWGKRLIASRTAVASTMETLLDRAPKAIAAALPLKSTAANRRVLSVNLDREVSEDVLASAVRYARLVAGCRYLASSASFLVKYENVRDEVVDIIHFYNNAILSERANASNLMQIVVDQQYDVAHTITSIVMGQDEADHLAYRDRMARSA